LRPLYLSVGRLHGMTVLHVRPSGGEELTVLVAETFRERLLGLAGLPTLAAGMALLIPRCRSVHTFGMRFDLDVLFVTVDHGSLCVHDQRLGLGPCRIVRASRAARAKPRLAALEVAASARSRRGVA
jgi:uncharacterized protein